MKFSVILALLLISSAKAHDLLPLKHGLYAKLDRPCNPAAKRFDYFLIISFWGNTINNTSTVRTISKLRKTSATTYTLQLNARGTGGIGEITHPTRLNWRITIPDPRHFTLHGDDESNDWSGRYRFCFFDIPAQ